MTGAASDIATHFFIPEVILGTGCGVRALGVDHDLLGIGFLLLGKKLEHPELGALCIVQHSLSSSFLGEKVMVTILSFQVGKIAKNQQGNFIQRRLEKQTVFMYANAVNCNHVSAFGAVYVAANLNQDSIFL